jgi:hypothetical protein
MRSILLQRYRNGEHREVWHDLVDLGSAVRDEAYYADALEVAAETMRRARHNVESIIVKLEKLGYEFTSEEPDRPILANIGGSVVNMGSLGSVMENATRFSKGSPFAQPGFEPRNTHEQAMVRLAESTQLAVDQLAASRAQWADQKKKKSAQGALNNPDVFTPPDRKLADYLKFFEEELGGPLPISLRQWYEQVGSVCLMGLHETLNPVEGSHSPDPLVIFPLREAAESDWGADLSDLDDEIIDLPLAPDALHKAHNSGGDPYSMKVPNPAAGGLFQWGIPDTTFVEYLRRAFAWGGFPGWEHASERPEKELAFLKADLLAL